MKYRIWLGKSGGRIVELEDSDGNTVRFPAAGWPEVVQTITAALAPKPETIH